MGFENLVIYNKCKTLIQALSHRKMFENLVIYNKCKIIYIYKSSYMIKRAIKIAIKFFYFL